MIKKIVLGIFTLALGLVILLGEAPLIYAQESATEEYTLEEITVTAQKREQELQKVASSVDVIQGYELTEMGHLDLDDALRNVSSALVQSVGEEMTVIIRGMDNDSMPGDGFSQVGVTVDGSFQKSWGVGTTGIYDMQRIEVIAGPQGTMYSRNSAGGVVNMITNNPTTEEVQASGSVETGNYNLVNTQGVLNVPISDSWAVRAAFISTKRDGYASTGVHDADDRSLRLKLGYTPSDVLSAVLTWEHIHIGGKSQGDGFMFFEDEDDVDNPWTGASPGDLFIGNNTSDKYYMNLDWKTPIGTLTFIPSFMDTYRLIAAAGWLYYGELRGPPGAPPGPPQVGFGFGQAPEGAERLYQAPEYFESPQEEWSYELRMASSEDFFMDWLVGLYYWKWNWDDHIFHKDLYYVDPDDPTRSVFIESTEFTGMRGYRGNVSKAAFGYFTYPITDVFRVTAGGRYTSEEEKGQDRATGDPTSDKSSHFDYNFGVEYDIGENTMLWVKHATGYNQVRGTNLDQTLKDYEVGSKSRFLNNQLQLNATAFYYDYKNFNVGMGLARVQEYMLNTETGEYELVYFDPAGVGDAVLYGLDVSMDYIITGKDLLNLALSYLSAEVDQVLVTYSYGGVQYPELVPPRTIGSGRTLNNAPELSVVGSYEHRFDLANGSAVTPSISARYTSEYICEFEVDERNILQYGLDPDKVNTEPSHIMADFYLNYTHHTGKWTLNSYVKNITNHAEKTGLMRGDLRVGPPRTYGVVLSVRF